MLATFGAAFLVIEPRRSRAQAHLFATRKYWLIEIQRIREGQHFPNRVQPVRGKSRAAVSNDAPSARYRSATGFNASTGGLRLSPSSVSPTIAGAVSPPRRVELSLRPRPGFYLTRFRVSIYRKRRAVVSGDASRREAGLDELDNSAGIVDSIVAIVVDRNGGPSVHSSVKADALASVVERRRSV